MSVVGHQSGASSVNLNGTFTWFVGPFTVPEDGTIAAVTWKLATDSQDTDYTFGVYADSTGAPGARLAQTAGEVIRDDGGGEHSIDLTAPLAVTNGQQVWLAMGHNLKTFINYDDGGSAGMVWVNTYTSGALSADGSGATTFDATADAYAYATITPGSPFTYQPRSIIVGQARNRASTY